MRAHDIKKRIAEYFFAHPTHRLRVRQIEREVKVPLPSAIRYVKELEKQGILKSTIVAKVKLYSSDRASKSFLLEKKMFNISILYSSGLINYITTEYGNPNIIVFGSYAKGEDIEKSDVDLYVETAKNVERLETFEKKLGKKIQIFQYKNISSVETKELANNILNGVILNGFIEVF